MPDTDLTLTTDQGIITEADPGEQIVFIGTGFAPHSTVVISIYSDPIVLGTAVTDALGNFSKPITVPATSPPARTPRWRRASHPTGRRVR